ncbi:MAG: squalene--hopene cyclase [Chloroflexi bacterium]|nr:squalene--hopene cyclase [Chloroflexota bacterium]
MVNVEQATVPQELKQALDEAIRRAQGYLLRIQYPEGYWWGELESNPTMEAEFLLLSYFLDAVDKDRWRKLTTYILGKQGEDGSWGQYYGAPGDVSTSVECYFALKLAGVSPDSPAMSKARGFILSKGGVPRVRVFTRIWLALFAQWDWRGVPALPPEMMFLPNWFPLNIYDFSSWARATIVPMLILLTQRPTKAVPDWASIDELYPVPRDQVDYALPRRGSLLGWSGLFRVADRLLRLYERSPWKPGRRRALRKAEAWIVAHQEADGSWGGIQPPWVYSLLALKALGYPMDHPVMERGYKGFDGFAIHEGDTLRVQACISPVWDTCLALIALQDSGLPADHPAIQKAARWLVKEQVLVGGDWQVKSPKTLPGGWAFEFENDCYPDLDDTAEVVIALHRARLPEPEQTAARQAVERGVRWLLGMQSKNGGWASFDKDNTRLLVTRIPFADFGETIDPPSADVTAHVVEMLGRLGYPITHTAVAQAMKYLRDEQEYDGCWFGRWGVNYIYGTGAVLPALEAIGDDMGHTRVRKAVEWVVVRQNPDGGWGESCASYADPSTRGQGPSTPSQTAWALLALEAAGEWAHPAVERGARYLLQTQRGDGSWDEPSFTGTGFPGYGIGRRLRRAPKPGEQGYQGADLPAGFMINYHLYRDYWPLMALGRLQRHLGGRARKSTDN